MRGLSLTEYGMTENELLAHYKHLMDGDFEDMLRRERIVWQSRRPASPAVTAAVARHPRGVHLCEDAQADIYKAMLATWLRVANLMRFRKIYPSDRRAFYLAGWLDYINCRFGRLLQDKYKGNGSAFACPACADPKLSRCGSEQSFALLQMHKAKWLCPCCQAKSEAAFYAYLLPRPLS